MRSRQLRQSSICQFSTCTWSFAEDLARFRSYGIESIGIWRRKLEDYGVDEAVDQLYNSKLNVSSLHWAGGFTGVEQSLKHSLSETFDAIRIADRINAGCLLVHPGGTNGHIFKHIDRVVRGAFQEVLQFAQDYSVPIAIEPIPGSKNSPWTIYDRFEQTLELLDQFPQLGINLDLYHVGLNEEVFDRLETLIDRIKLVQIADRNFESLERASRFKNRRYSYRLPLGLGDVDHERWIHRLNELGYRGAFEVELHGSSMPHDGHFRTVDQAVDFFQSPTIRQALQPTQPKPVKKHPDSVQPKRVING